MKRFLITISMLLVAFIACSCGNNNAITEKIYYYVTDNGTVLHLSGTKPKDPNYVEGNDDYISIVKNVSASLIYNDYLKCFDLTYDGQEFLSVAKTSDIKKIKIDNNIVLSDARAFFLLFNEVEEIVNIDKIDTGKVNNMSCMFYGLGKLKKIDLSSFNTKNVNDMSYMFMSCHSLTEIDLSNFDTSHVTNMSNMFGYCYSLIKIDLSNFNTKNVKSMSYMFISCESLSKIDLSNFDTTQVTDMSFMFCGLNNLKKLNLKNFNTKNVKSMSVMFSGCYSLTEIDLSSFDYSNLEIENSLIGSTTYKLNPSIYSMFSDCTNLRTIYSSSDIIVNGYYDRADMFNGCVNLVGGNGSKYDENLIDISQAVIDSPYQRGYFTYDPSRYVWKKDCYYINGVKLVDRWFNDNFSRYYAGSDGKILKNTWKDGKYLGSDGKMLVNTYTPDNKFVNSYGDVVDINSDLNSIDQSTIIGNSWYRTNGGIWYYFENNRTTKKTGWFVDPQDGQTYYLDKTTGIMLTGWQEIDGNKYYFNERGASIPNWYYVEDTETWASYGHKIKSLGSMFRDEETPDGKKVDKNGKLVK